MKYCYECGWTTAGEPFFCNYCGRSYDVKLCPKLHLNPRLAEACSQCGTRDLSTPQPKIPLRWRIFAFLGQWLSAAVLFLLSLQVISRMNEDLRSVSKVQNSHFIVAAILAFFWSLWTVLPDWLRRLIHRSIKRNKERRK
jgi:hypothetical protein